MRKHLVLVKTSKTHGEKRLCLLFRLFSNDDCSKTSVISNFSPSETVLMGEITRAVYKLMWISWNILQGDHKSNCILRWAAKRHTFYIMRKFKGWNWTLEPQKIIFLTQTIPPKMRRNNCRINKWWSTNTFVWFPNFRCVRYEYQIAFSVIYLKVINVWSGALYLHTAPCLCYLICFWNHKMVPGAKKRIKSLNPVWGFGWYKSGTLAAVHLRCS